MRARTRLAAAVAATMFLGLLSVGTEATDDARSVPPFSSTATFASLPASPAPALEVGSPDLLSPARYLSRWSVVRRSSAAHAAPIPASPVVARLSTTTPDGTANALTVLRTRTGSDHRLWVEVR